MAITYTFIGLADLLILAGAARAALPRGPRLAALVLLTGGFLAYVALILAHHDFLYVGWDYLGTLLFLLVFGLDLVRRGEPGAGFVLGGVLASGAGALVQYLRITLHPQFNDNDLFHVLQMAGVWLFFRGGLRLRDRSSATARPVAPLQKTLRLRNFFGSRRMSATSFCSSTAALSMSAVAREALS